MLASRIVSYPALLRWWVLEQSQNMKPQPWELLNWIKCCTYLYHFFVFFYFFICNSYLCFALVCFVLFHKSISNQSLVCALITHRVDSDNKFDLKTAVIMSDLYFSMSWRGLQMEDNFVRLALFKCKFNIIKGQPTFYWTHAQFQLHVWKGKPHLCIDLSDSDHQFAHVPNCIQIHLPLSGVVFYISFVSKILELNSLQYPKVVTVVNIYII